MPTLPVTDVPVQISQSITKTALLQNTGTPSVYLANDASVSPNAYGMVLTKGSSCVWPANSDLWAVTEPGERSSVSVLYGASGASLGQVTASIDGPVDANVTNPLTVSNILAPVQVQGGGEVLIDFDNEDVRIAPGETFVRELVTSSGLIYPAIDMNMFLSSTSSGEIAWGLTRDPNLFSGEARGRVYSPPSSGAWPFYPQVLRAIVPNNTGRGLYLVIHNDLATDITLLGTVFGTSTAPVTAMTPVWDLVQLVDQPYLNAADGSSILFPASFTPYTIGMYVAPGATVTNAVERESIGGNALRARPYMKNGMPDTLNGPMYVEWQTIGSGAYFSLIVVGSGDVRILMSQ